MNYPRILFFTSVAATIAIAACNPSNTSGPTSPEASPQSTTYQYTAYDPGGAAVATGTLTLSFEGTAVAGQRDIKGSAPEAGKGTVSGQELTDGSVEIDLNPGSAAIVTLQGKFEGSVLMGKRFLDTGDPPLARTIGTFTITRLSAGG